PRSPCGAATSKKRSTACAELLQLLQRGDRPGGVLRVVAGDVADEFRADRDRRHAAEVDPRVAERARDLCAKPRLVAALDAHRMDVLRLAETGFLRRLDRLRALHRGH